MRIRKIKAQDKDAVLDYLQRYPYKDMQRRTQGLDISLLNEYHCKSILEQAQSTDAYIGMNNKGEVVGLAIVRPRPWHSEVFEMRMAKVSPFLLFGGTSRQRETFMSQLLDKFDSKKYDHVELRVDVNEWENVALLENHGFHCVDCSIKLNFNLQTSRLTLPRLPDTRYKVTACKERDNEQLMEISRNTHKFNHFFSDPTLDTDKAHELFAQWINKTCTSLAYRVWVAYRDEKALGFSTILVNEKFNKAVKRKICVLDFIAVRKGYQGKGIGRWLLNESLIRMRRDEEFEHLELRTSINNFQALNLYSTNGFYVISVDTILTRKV